MLKVCPLLLVCVAVLYSLTTSENTNTEHLQLIVLWPPGFCHGGGCNTDSPPYTWTIHGLWPSVTVYGNAVFPNYCKRPPLLCEPPKHLAIVKGAAPVLGPVERYISELDEKVRSRMESQWKSFTKKSDYEFWGDQYCKHGTCCDDILKEPADYFEKTVELHDLYTAELEKKLENDDAYETTPKIRRSFTQLNDALIEKANAASNGNLDEEHREKLRFSFWCKNVNVDGGNKQLLTQVGVCFNNKFGLKKCPTADNFGGRCDETEDIYLKLSPEERKSEL